MRIVLILLCIPILLFMSCAEANDPVQPEAPKPPMVISKTYPVIGDPVDFDITDEYIYVAEDETGFSIHDRNSGEKVLWSNENEDSLSVYRAGLIEYFADEEMLFVYDKEGSDGFKVFHTEDINHLGLYFPITGNTSSIIDFHILPYPHIDFPQYPIQPIWLKNESGVNKVYFSIYGDDIYYNTGNVRLSSHYVNSLFIDDSLFYCAAKQQGVVIEKIYSSSDESAEYISEVDTPGEALEVLKHGNYLYVADRQAGLQVIDISDIDNPVLLPESGYDTSGYAKSLAIHENYLAVVSGGGGVYLFNVTNPAAPEFKGQMDDDEIGYTNKVEFMDGKIYVASRDKGIVELEIQ